MRILIIGGTRFIGPHVVRRVIAKGHDVTLFHRGKTKVDLPDGVKHILGNRQDLSDFQNEFKKIQPDIVLDMIPLTEQDARMVVNTFKDITSRIIAISSQDVYRAYGILIGKEDDTIENVPLKEDAALRKKIYPYRLNKPRAQDDPQKALDDYDKILVENVIMGESELPGTILRLPMVYGPGDSQHRLFEYVKRMDDKRPAIILEQGLANWQWSRGYVENIADAIALAITNENSKNRIYNVGEPDALTLAEWVKKIGQIADWQGKVVIVSRDKLPPDTVTNINTNQHLVVDTTQIRKELGYSESIPLNEAIRRTIDWERSHPPDKIKPEAFDYATEDKILNALGC